MHLFVGNLPFDVDWQALREMGERHGEVARATLITDRETGRSRGFGFLDMPDDDEARKAIAALNGSDCRGRPLRVNEAKPKEA